MLKNALFLILFVLLYGGFYLFAVNGTGDFKDRNGYAVMDEERYTNKDFSFELRFQPEWIVYDGKSVLDSRLASSSEAELETSYGKSLDNMAFLFGSATPYASVDCVSYLNYNYPAEDFTEHSIATLLTNMERGVTGAGGVINDKGYRILNDENTGRKLLMYYYDYEVSEKYYSKFVCFANSEQNAIMFNGTYDTPDGLKLLKELIESKFMFV